MNDKPTQLEIEMLDDLPAANPEWAQLGLECGNPFMTWEWASSWWRQYGEDRRQLILGCRDGEGKLVGVLPLYFSRERPLRVLRFVGHGEADQLGPVCAAADREAVAAVLRRALTARRDWDFCVAERLSVEEGWPQLIGGVETRREKSLTIRFRTDDWDEFLATYSSHFRAQVRKFERRLTRDHELKYRKSDQPERLEEDMGTFFALHNARWQQTSEVFAQRAEAFHRELAGLALAAGWLHLTFLEVDGHTVAGAYGYRLGAADWLYQQGRDPGQGNRSVGQVLLNNSIRETLVAGIPDFKFLLGGEAYKDRYAELDTPVATTAIGRNALLRTALAVALGLKALTRRARAAVPARGA